jgi:serine/threonine protein kinase/Flp pilus assembly protein TadD
MICLLRVGFNDAEEPDEKLFAPVTDRLGNYRIERRDDGSLWELGRGAMGVTYRAVDTSLKRPVALKLIDSEWAKRGAEARERFMREARTAASLRHPNIATVYHFGIREENGQCFCAMELVEGETLETRVRRTGPLDALTTIEIALQVSSALAAAEKQGLVHRDLKPANLMFVTAAPDANDSSPGKAEKADTIVKVIDFGVAKALAEKPDAMGLTHGGFVGTPAFASPEQFTDARVEVRSDIYSLGATLWYLLTGNRPFEGATIEQIRASQHSQTLPIDQLKAARVPSRLISLLVWMLATEPAARPDVRALTSQLQACRAQVLDRWKAARRLALTAGLIGIAAAAFVLFLRWHNRAMSQNAAPANISKKSIAVLPFEDLSDDKEHAFFADGVQDDILTKLAKVADLKVISRTSVMQYRGKQDLRQIGQGLGVSHVLEGTVRRSGDKVHVNAQLVDTRTDTHIWAEEYHRDLNDVFAIEAELAQSLVNRLRATLSASERLALQERPTNDLAAYDLYTQAKTLVATTLFSTPAYEGQFEAIRLLNQAIERDPAFALAYFHLAEIHDRLYFGGTHHTPAELAMADAAIQSLTRLRPNSGEAHLALAKHLYWGYRDYDRAREELKLAQKSLPNDSMAFFILASIDRRQGRWAESIKNFERSVELDPQNLSILPQLPVIYACLRRYADAERAIALAPKDSTMRANRDFIELQWHADTYQLTSTIESIIAEDSGEAENIARPWLFVSLCQRDFDGARRALAALPIAGCQENNVPYPKAWCEGVVAQTRGNTAAARAAFTNARTEIAKLLAEQPDYPEGLSVLGMVDAALSHKEDAIREGRRAVELLPVTKDTIIGAKLVGNLALIYAWTGEKDLAFEQLAIAARIPGDLSYGELRLHPYWDPLRGDPRFEKIVASLAPK